jgi:hypothetical protein
MKLSQNVRAIIDDGGAVLLHPETGKYLSANKSGAQICQALRTEQTEDQIVDLLVATYRLAPSVARRDVRVFIEDLRTRGMLDGN